MAWRGFFRESVDFCGYGGKTPWGNLRWWCAFPRAAWLFYWYSMAEWWRAHRARWGEPGSKA